MKESAGRKFIVTIHKTIAEIDAGAWDNLVNNTMFHTYAWMQFMEASAQEDVVPFYTAVRRDGCLVGAGVCYRVMRRIFGVSLPFLVCNFPLSEKMVLFTEKEHEKTVLPLLCNTLETIAGQEETWGYLSPLSLMGWRAWLKIEGFTS